MKELELLNFVLQLDKSRGAYTISTFAVFTRFWLNREWEKEQISVFVSLPSLSKWMMLSRWHKHQTQSNVYRVKHNSEKRQVQLFCHTFDFVVMNLNLKADMKFWKVIICLWEMWILNSILDKPLEPPITMVRDRIMACLLLCCKVKWQDDYFICHVKIHHWGCFIPLMVYLKFGLGNLLEKDFACVCVCLCVCGQE